MLDHRTPQLRCHSPFYPLSYPQTHSGGMGCIEFKICSQILWNPLEKVEPILLFLSVAGLSDLLLMNGWGRKQHETLGNKRFCGFLFPFSLGLLSLNDASFLCLRISTKRSIWWGNENSSQKPAINWGLLWTMRSPAPVKPLDDCSSCQYFDGTSWQTLSQSHRPKPLQNSWASKTLR